MGWGTGEQLQNNFDKLSFLCFFHDIHLSRPELLKVFSKEELENGGFSPEEEEIINNHANKIATFVQSFPHAPSGVDVLLRQHHGTLNGVGFTERYSASISPMAIAFIVVERFVSLLLELSEDQFINYKTYLPNIFGTLRSIFQVPSYKRVIDTLEMVLKKTSAPVS